MNEKDVFNENAGEFINASKASNLQTQYLEKEEKNGKLDPIRSEFFGKEKLNILLTKSEKVVGLRIAYGLEAGEPSLILVPVDKDGNNIALDKSGLKDMPDGDDYLANGPKCPLACGGGNN
jgi:hypothetical protein